MFDAVKRWLRPARPATAGQPERVGASVTIPSVMVRCVHCQQPTPLADMIRVETDAGHLLYRTCAACAEIHELADDPQARMIGHVVPAGAVRIIQTRGKLPV